MRGFPNYLSIATRKDVENLMSLFPKETCEFLKSLVNDNYVWQNVSEAFVNPEDGIEDSTHQLVPVYSEDNKELLGYLQQELVEDPNSRLHSLGYTVAKVTQLVNSLSA